MADHLSFGISTCPNDTFIFGALFTGLVDAPFTYTVVLDDVEVLNRLAINRDIDVIKVSYGVIPEIIDDYMILTAGGALGFGCGPLLVAKPGVSIDDLSGKKIAIPGAHTTAFRVFRHFFPELTDDFVELRFDAIMPAIGSGEIDAGLVIHEGRFTYERLGLAKVCDLGELWEERHHAPIPLGAIVIRRDRAGLAPVVNEAIRASINRARNDIGAVMPFIRRYAAEMEDDIVAKHIELYVNEYSLDNTPVIDSLCSFLGCSDADFAR